MTRIELSLGFNQFVRSGFSFPSGSSLRIKEMSIERDGSNSGSGLAGRQDFSLNDPISNLSANQWKSYYSSGYTND